MLKLAWDGSAKPRQRDYLTKKGAEELATDIKTFWLSKGYDIRVWIEKVERRRLAKKVAVADGRPMFQIRSNLLNGLPPRGTEVR